MQHRSDRRRWSHIAMMVTLVAFGGVAPMALVGAVQAAEPHAGALFAHGNNDFAFELFRQLPPHEGNGFFSPYSVRTALSLVYAGARGETAAQLRQALHLPLGDEVHAAHREVGRALRARGGDGLELDIANGLWGQRSHPFLPAFVDLVERSYEARLELVDFVSSSEAVRQMINGWVEDRTRERIHDLIPPGGVTPDTRLVLVNAISFDGRWAAPFDEARTREAPFHLAHGGTVPVPLMTTAEPPVAPYYAGEGFQAIELDYRGRDLSLVVVLPDDPAELPRLEAQLDARSFEALLQRMAPEPVQVYLPRFSLTWGSEDLTGPLAALGVRDLFVDGTADLSGIDGGRDLFVSGVFHKAFVEVHEEGTEAAAATGVVVGVTAMPPPMTVFRADRPFLFLLRDKATGTILFLGRLVDPGALLASGADEVAAGVRR